jgi:hypothetical protein
VIIVPAIVFPVLLAVFITFKLSNYLLTYYPIAAIAGAWFATRLWDGGWGRIPQTAVRGALLVALAWVSFEAGSRLAHLQKAANVTTPYASFIFRLEAQIPEGAEVLGLHNYWFGLDSHPYRSWLLPVLLFETEDPPQEGSFHLALQKIDPDVVLMDSSMRDYFDALPANDFRPRDFASWLSAENFSLSATVDDPSYGLIEIYQRGD